VKYLLDASALLPLVTRRGKQLIVEASRENLVTTDLAVYEACNSLWKLATLLKSISLEDAVDVATVLKELTMRNIIELIDYTKLDFSSTLGMARKKNLTFYDASFIKAAESIGAVLVTEDEKLKEAARKSVKTITYEELERALAKKY
jgi:predicted nucleic acid-binding protein